MYLMCVFRSASSAERERIQGSQQCLCVCVTGMSVTSDLAMAGSLAASPFLANMVECCSAVAAEGQRVYSGGRKWVEEERYRKYQLLQQGASCFWRRERDDSRQVEAEKEKETETGERERGGKREARERSLGQGERKGMGVGWRTHQVSEDTG